MEKLLSKCIILLNSPYLGGAERSIILQSLHIPQECLFIVPTLEGDNGRDVISFINETKKDHNYKIESLCYPSALYQVSRSGAIGRLFTLTYSFLLVFLELRRIHINAQDIIWINGNKVGFPTLIYLTIKGFKGKMIWHFRDYPYDKGVFKIVWALLRKNLSMKKVLVSNSNSVTSEVRRICNGSDNVFKTLYNPVGKIGAKKKSHNQIKRIGIVSMFAPWKGIHTILEFEKLYHKELKDLGIESIDIYGGDIYKTAGAHDDYLNQLKRLYKNGSLIKFRGRQSPSVIYSDIDLLIHPSIDKEPFGRIIAEAFSCGLPVISTGLGGSGELVLNKVTGLTYFPYDHSGLFQSLSTIVRNDKFRSELIKNSSEHLVSIEKEQRELIQQLVLKA